MSLSYEASGVRYEPLDAFKRACQRAARGTVDLLEKHGFREPAAVRGESAYLIEADDHYLAHVEEGLGTKNLDYNGRLCMVSAAAANKKALGIDRAANPWADIPKAEVIWVAGANIAECFPILTSYLWQARENGARIVQPERPEGGRAAREPGQVD